MSTRCAALAYARGKHPDLVAARADHDAATERWLESTSDLSGDAVHWRPTPEAWSIAQCLDHVTRITAAVLPGVRAATGAAHARGTTASEPFRYGPIGIWLQAMPAHALRHLAHAERVLADERQPLSAAASGR